MSGEALKGAEFTGAVGLVVLALAIKRNVYRLQEMPKFNVDQATEDQAIFAGTAGGLRVGNSYASVWQHPKSC